VGLKNYSTNYDDIDFSRKEDYAPPVKISFASKRSSIEAPMIAGDYKPYECPITGKTIDGRIEHKQNLEQHGCRVHEKGEFEDVKKNGVKDRNAEIDRAIDRSVDAIAHTIDI
jgi:hypothetical protein